MIAVLVAAGMVAGAGAAPALTAPPPAAASEDVQPSLTNLAHLDHLMDEVVPPA